MKNQANRKKHKQTLLIWIAIYPLITLLYYLMGEQLLSLPIPVRTLIVTAVAVPIMVYLLMPLLDRIINRQL